jgi:sugar-specific transcriptional regulator TrmB
MRASLHRYKVMDAEALIERIQQEFIERVKAIEGLVGYYVIDGGDGTVTSITLGETEEAVEALAVDSQDSIVERAAHLVEGAPDMTAGEVRVRVER